MRPAAANSGRAQTGEQFRMLMASGTADAKDSQITRMRVLARSQPEDKRVLVAFLKSQGHVVAATGENDDRRRCTPRPERAAV